MITLRSDGNQASEMSGLTIHARSNDPCDDIFPSEPAIAYYRLSNPVM